MTRYLAGLALALALVPTLARAPVSAAQDDEPVEHAVLWDGGQIVDLGTLGGTNSFAFAINAVGQVAGLAETASGEEHAFLWDDGQMIDLGTLGGKRSVARGINDAGQVVGVSETAGGEEHAFLWQAGRMTDLGTGDGSASRASAINNAGQVAGWTGALFDSHASIWDRGEVIVLADLGGTSDATGINDAGQAVGWTEADGGKAPAVLWTQGQVIELVPESVYVAANGINARGQVAGFLTTDEGETHAYIWDGGQVTDLGTLGGDYSVAFAAGLAGQVVGKADTAEGETHAVLWTAGQMSDLGTLGGADSSANAINSVGQIAGSAQIGSVPTIATPAVASPGVPASPVAATLPGVSGTTYTSPTFGYTLAWDPAWSVYGAASESWGDLLILTDSTTVFSITGFVGTVVGFGDAMQCLAGTGPNFLSKPNRDVAVATGADGRPLQGGDADRAYVVYTYLHSPEGREPRTLVTSVECRTLAAGSGFLVVTQTSPIDAYNAGVPRVQALMATLQVPPVATPSP